MVTPRPESELNPSRQRTWPFIGVPRENAERLVAETALHGHANLCVLFAPEGNGSDIAGSYFYVTEAHQNHGYILFAGTEPAESQTRFEPFVGFIDLADGTGEITFSPSRGRLIGPVTKEAV